MLRVRVIKGILTPWAIVVIAVITIAVIANHCIRKTWPILYFCNNVDLIILQSTSNNNFVSELNLYKLTE